jgi:AcrR family transcriptional regulator
MPDEVNRARSYRSQTRGRQRAATRAAIVEAATSLFVECGYAATTITNIAAHADVSPETVYVIFGTKRDVLRSVVEAAATGGHESVLDEAWLEQVRVEPDQQRRLALMAGATRDVLRRVAQIDEVVRSVATADPEIAELRHEHDARRLRDTRVLAKLLADVGPLRMRVDEAADLMWALSRSTDLYRALTVDRGWSHDRAFDALNDVLARVLLPDERDST